MKTDKYDEPVPAASFRSTCPIACVLDVLGDRWTLLVVRDLFLDKHRFTEFAASPEGIPTNILTDRLKKLEAQGIVKKVRYQEKPVRMEYYLTSKGADLGRVLASMRKWAEQHIPGVLAPETFPELQTRD